VIGGGGHGPGAVAAVVT